MCVFRYLSVAKVPKVLSVRRLAWTARRINNNLYHIFRLCILLYNCILLEIQTVGSHLNYNYTITNVATIKHKRKKNSSFTLIVRENYH